MTAHRTHAETDYIKKCNVEIALMRQQRWEIPILSVGVSIEKFSKKKSENLLFSR